MNTKKNTENFNKIIDWVQVNIADKCPDIVEYTSPLIYEGKGTGWRVLHPGVLQIKVYGNTGHSGPIWMFADEWQCASEKCIVNYLLRWKLERRELESALAAIQRKEAILENFTVE